MRAQCKIELSNSDRQTSKGFSLIELLIVIAVILIIAAIAIPNFIRSKMRANEAAAVQNLRTISTAEIAYATMYGIGFCDSLTKLAGAAAIPDPNSAELIDDVLAAGRKSGYLFTFGVGVTDSQGHVVTYSLNADPILPGSSGQNHFYSDQTAVIRFNNTASASSSDSPIS